jgi:transcriptional regulator with XRE-family HTH domain
VGVNAVKFSEKLKLVRTTNHLTQARFAESIGISRGNLSGLELGNVKPTALVINCISLMYNIDKSWLTDERNNDLSALNGSNRLIDKIMEQYGRLNGPYKKFVENQIKDLLEIQNRDKSE